MIGMLPSLHELLPAAKSPDPAGPGLMRRLSAKVWRVLRAPLSTREWRIIVWRQSIEEVVHHGLDTTNSIELSCPSWFRFWADPCLVLDDDGSLWVFVEEFDRWRGIGHIAALHIKEGRVARSTPVLAGGHHRAFPRVWRGSSSWLATVDGCETPGRIYQFTALGEKWSVVPRVVLPAPLTDPTIDSSGLESLLVGTNWMKDESSDVEVWLNEDGSLIHWRPQTRFSYSDARHGRGAGNADVLRGLRAVQDGVEAYGTAVSLIAWPVTDGRPKVLRRFDGSQIGSSGVHTFTWTTDGHVMALDAWQRRPDPLGWLWKLRDLRHLKRCRRRTLGLGRFRRAA